MNGKASTFAQRLQLLIDARYATNHSEDGMRTHLGASIIGESCLRYLWYSWHWVDSEQWEGRMLRLVYRGQREEEVFKVLLESVGAKVYTHDEAGNQFRVSFFGGHFGGSTDGVATGLMDEALACEMKTFNIKRFTELKAKGVHTSNPKHYKQAQVYMRGLDLKKCLYLAVCKNDDELYLELIDYDPDTANHMLARAESVIFGAGIPAKISNNSSWFECKFCALADVCHHGKEARVNCRTCRHSAPLREGGWACGLGQEEIRTTPKVGCEKYEVMEELKV